MATQDENNYYLTPAQLCIGLYIHLDLSWMDHPFTFSSFKIKSLDQIETLRRLGLEKIRYSPAKSDSVPLPRQSQLQINHIQSALESAKSAPESESESASESTHEQEIEASAEDIAHLKAKRARIARLQARRAAIESCEKDFLSAAQVAKGLDRAIFSRPKDAAEAGGRMVERMVDSLMTDKDIAIHLMNDRASGEEVYFHSLNVAVLALMLAKELGLTAEEIRTLGTAAIFHDVGKAEIPDRILLKTEQLNRAEQTLYEQHCQWSVDAGRKAGLSADILTIISQHHEFCDGSGYPGKLKQQNIHPLARILALVNHFDTLCNRAIPADSHTPHEALALIFAQQRSKFDPQPLNTFIRCMGVYPPGSVVMLSNETYGLVVSVNSSRPLKPQVLVHVPGGRPEDAPIIDLEEEADLNISKSLKSAQLPRDAMESLNPRKRLTYFFAPKDND